MAKRSLFEDDDLDSDMDEFGGIRYNDYEVIIKKCKCGFKGELDPDPFGYACKNCGHVLIESR